MKKLLGVGIILLLVLFLAACGDDDNQSEEVSTESEKETVEPIDVEVNENIVIQDDGTVYIEGETNLPDYAELMFTVDGDDYRAQSKDVVMDGKFESETFSKKGESLDEGDYELSISLSIPSNQDEKFVEVAGEEYENLTGELMDESDLGKSMSYETTFTIE